MQCENCEDAGASQPALDRITDATYYNASTRASDQLRSAEALGRSSHKFVSKKSVCWDVERPRAFSRFSIDRTQILNSFLCISLANNRDLFCQPNKNYVQPCRGHRGKKSEIDDVGVSTQLRPGVIG